MRTSPARPRRWIPLALAPVLLLTVTAAGPAYPAILPLPDGFAPEGVAAAGNTFYVGSLVDGDVYRGSLRSGQGSRFVDVSGRQALGLKPDTAHGLLFVAGGFTGHAYVYDLRTGADVADFTLAPGDVINDVVVTRDAAYFTDSFAPKLFRVAIAADGTLGAAETITVTGPAGVSHPGAFGLNGIEATPGDRSLIVAHTELGALFTVDPRSGASRSITITSGSLVPGTPDGILRVGRDLWVVENTANTLVRVRLSVDWSTGAVAQTVTNPAFQVPTTVARHGARLAVVNAKFGITPTPTTPYEVVQLKP